MAHYIIGDIHGCYDELQQLLKLINFTTQDKLWCTGDLINVGPRSLDTLRFLYLLGDNFNFTLGNHEISLLALAYGSKQKFLQHDNHGIKEILRAVDSQDLIHWIHNRPLFYYDQQFDISIVHAGVAKAWSVQDAERLSALTVEYLRNPKIYDSFSLKRTEWSDNLTMQEQVIFVINVMTRARFCLDSGEFEFTCKAVPEQAPKHLIPWYDVIGRKTKDDKIFFGHWGALCGQSTCLNAISLDTGCVWGGMLTAYRLDDKKIFQVSSPGYAKW